MTDRLFDPGPRFQLDPREGWILHRDVQACRHCGVETRWLWSVIARRWLCDGYTEGAQGCGLGQGATEVERMATPDEVDNGYDLGIAYDTVPVGGWPS
jgi:hypothetical protein